MFQNIHQPPLNAAYEIFWIWRIESSRHGCICEVMARIWHIDKSNKDGKNDAIKVTLFDVISGIGGGGDGVLKVKSSGVIGERVRVMSIDGDELILEAIDDEEVSLVDGAFGDRGCCFGEGVLSSSCVRSMNNFLGGIIMILGFLESLEVKGGFQPERLAQGLKVGLIRHIQGIGYGVLEFLGVGTTFDIFQNIHILYLQYGVLTSSGYGVLIFFPLWSLVSADTDTPYLP
ncbi:hypothetical protein Tco_0831728 [Tanacetum coccineum]